jgi:error-prone DNA polymerase
LLRLAAAGALEVFGWSSREALWQIQGLELDSQSIFFGVNEEILEKKASGNEEHGNLQQRSEIPRETHWDTLHREYKSQGYSLVHHPLGILRPVLERWSAVERARNSPGFTRANQIEKLRDGSPLRIAGLLNLQQKPPTAKGFAFLTLEDETGLINIVLMPDIYLKYRLVISFNPFLHVIGTLQKVDRVLHLKAQVIKPLPVERLLEKGSGIDAHGLV